MSKTNILIHIVFATKRREKTIELKYKRELFAYIMGIIKSTGSTLIRINGMGDHVHMLINLHPSVSLANLVQSVKQSSSLWIKENRIFPFWDGWGVGYYGVSIGVEAVEGCRRYIINQEEHHRVLSFREELQRIAEENELEWYEDDIK